jgi:hypothetical protein
MSGLRQGLAIQIVFYAIRFVETRNFRKYLVYILLATSIHWTAIILLPLYFLFNKQISQKLTIFIFLTCLIIFTFQIKWLEGILGDMLIRFNALSLLSDKINSYTINETLAKVRGWDLYSIYNFTRILFIVVVINKYKNKIRDHIQHVNILYNFVIFELICIFGLFEFLEISERLKFYFAIAEIILLGSIIFLFRIKSRIVTLPIFVFVIALNAYPFLLEVPSTIAYHPYQNYLFYKMFDLKSDGYQRLIQHAISHE